MNTNSMKLDTKAVSDLFKIVSVTVNVVICYLSQAAVLDNWGCLKL